MLFEPSSPETMLFAIILLVAVLTFRFDDSGASMGTTKLEANVFTLKNIHFAILSLLLLVWGYITVLIARPSNQVAHKNSTDNLNKALKLEPEKCAEAGITTTWFNTCNALLSKLVYMAGLLVLIVAIVSFILVYPMNLVEAIGTTLDTLWADILSTYSQKEIFIGGILVSHLAAFWGLTLLYGLLDLFSPSCLMVFKIQSSVEVTWADMGKASIVALMNQVLVVVVLFLVFEVIPFTAPNAFDAKLPSLFELILSLAICVPFAEIVFYTMHRILHTDWFWTHVHYIHHSWTAPFAPCCIYAHPIEFLIGNVPVLLIGPLVTGCHMSVWVVWVFMATADTAAAHSGWHLPLLGNHEGHDYHHSSGHIDNLGVIGTLDNLFKTNLNYLNSWYMGVNQNYGLNADYPVDKIIYSSGLHGSGGDGKYVEEEDVEEADKQ